MRWRALPWLLLVLAGGRSAGLAAEPIVAIDDAQVIEQLPPSAPVGRGSDPAAAARDAMALLDAARQQGDPRPAGRALARLARWQRDPQAPAEIVIALASAEQYLHQFGAAGQRLQALVQRDPAQPQAWLMLATLHRGQGRYAESDAACAQVQRTAPAPYGRACLAENRGLRGEFDAARAELTTLRERAPAALRGWLSTTLAELEERAGRPHAAATAWQDAIAAAPGDGYALAGWADFLLAQGRAGDAWQALQAAPRTDGLLLRLAIAARRAQRPDADALRAELRARFAQADLRPESGGHERERAIAALDLDDRPRAALLLARRNTAWQREAIDLQLLWRCAAAAGDDAAQQEARALAARIGIVDARWPGG